MYEKKMDEELGCGIRVAFKIFGGKWKPCIIDAISKGYLRPVQMRQYIPQATLRVIEMQLAELLHFAVVEKSTSMGYPKRSEYRLTDFGKSILPLLELIEKWGSKHAPYVQHKMGLSIQACLS